MLLCIYMYIYIYIYVDARTLGRPTLGRSDPAAASNRTRPV